MTNLFLPNGYQAFETSHKRRLGTIVLEKLLRLFSIRNVAFMMFLSIYTIFILLLRDGFPFEESHLRRRSRNVIIRDIHDDYDVGCNGYSMDYRIKEQQRILQSVRSELIDSSSKLKEVNVVYEELNKKIPEKQSELTAVLDEIESARRTLKELQDRRNVRIFLPHRPLYPRIVENSNPSQAPPLTSSTFTWESAIDYSRCSISSFMPLYVYPLSKPNAQLEEFKMQLLSQGNIVTNPNIACLLVILTNEEIDISSMNIRNEGRNHVIINVGKPFYPKNLPLIMVQQHDPPFERSLDYNVFLEVPRYDASSWKLLKPILPLSRKQLILVLFNKEANHQLLSADLSRLKDSALSAGDKVLFLNCSSQSDKLACLSQREQYMRDSTFCVLLNSLEFTRNFWESLRNGCIPVVLSMTVRLPFQDSIDWNLASIRVAISRFPEIHFIIRSFEMSEVLEMRRMGRFFFERYLGDTRVVIKTLLASFRERLGLPSPAENVVTAVPLFNDSFTAPILTPINVQPFDDEYLGPLEAAIDSPIYLHNFSSIHMYSYRAWNKFGISGKSPEFLVHSADPPAESEFYPDTNVGFRPIEPGSGVEFSRALGGNRVREQFTVVLLTYNRDAVLAASLERLHRIPYLNKVIVIWNNVDREPLGAWPRLHVPVEFIKVSKNSLNNRFVPWDRIRTEAILSLDDDIDLKQHEIVFAFRVWRENRHRIVGFPARYHARYGDEMYYNSNHTCQLSIILTGAAFLHKSYFHAYTNEMPEAIRRHVDEVTNCEDIAMNFLVSHLTREPPIKTTSKWTIRCPTCTETLSQDESHFRERHECIRLFTRIYGYNPLKFSQFRADSILFKTRLPPDKQKCFRFV
uniref:Exostosin and EXTL2 domain containing protein n=1 Tax=Haemonchus contortus TaxID=6289 RepID=A0A7I4YDR4_HAECO